MSHMIVLLLLQSVHYVSHDHVVAPARTLSHMTMLLLLQPGPRWVWLPIVLRFLFVPFFCFCNFKPDMRQLPVFINNDYVYITGGILMAVTSGYFSSLSMMYVPRWVTFSFILLKNKLFHVLYIVLCYVTFVNDNGSLCSLVVIIEIG